MNDFSPGKTPFKGRQAAYDQAASWASDIHGSLRASRRVAWIIAAAAVAVAVLEAVAIALMAP